MDSLKIFPIEAGPVATFGYLIADTHHKVAAVIDVPLESADFFLKTAEQHGTPIQAIWLTHSHFDHIGDAEKLKRATKAPVYIHPADEYRLGEPSKHISFPLPFALEGVTADKYFQHGDKVSCGDWHFEVRLTPGHTEGGICLIDTAHNLAFVGDTLFAGSVGRTNLQGGDMPTLLDSIKTQLFTLPDEMLVLPGHGNTTTIGTERRTNPFLRAVA